MLRDVSIAAPKEGNKEGISFKSGENTSILVEK